jgi:hypothetical protein
VGIVRDIERTKRRMPPSGYSEFQQKLQRLVGHFKKHLKDYVTDAYDEASLRNDFLNPFWNALGWDLENTAQKSQLLRDVQIETRVKIQGRKKRADYIFRTDGLNRFVCEAKRPKDGLGLKGHYQAQRYAFNLKLYIAVLTDFQEFKVFVVGGKPESNDPVPPIRDWHFSEYSVVAQQIWDLFSRESVGNGSLERFVAELPKQEVKGKPYQGWFVKLPRERTVDAAFLSDIEQQRVALARDLLKENKGFHWNDVTLNEVIQRVLDRILFVRFCEDRDIETGVALEEIVNEWREIPRNRPPLYPRLVSHFKKLDSDFNGALFRKGHESEKVKISDAFLTGIIDELSSEDSPYLFSTLPVEILGSVYERFIGKVVRVKKGGAISVEDKPEARKAGGVYYTPRYIVSYIIERSVGDLLVDAGSPDEFTEIKVLDPACGSGSFLIRAFERICEAYLAWFHNHPRKQNPRLCYRDQQGNLLLTTHLKRQIVLGNIYGVDLDPQAVEVTMLSLYLKILEGETRDSVIRQQELFPDEKLLPDLSANIRRGNSLIQSDYFDLFAEDDEKDALRPLDWDAAFPKIMKNGGFNAVVGNPPYYNIDKLGKNSPVMSYLKTHYPDVWNDKTDILNYFLRRAVELTDDRVGMIVSRAFLEAYKSDRLRAVLRRTTQLQNIVDFGDFRVFEAGIATAIIIMQKNPKPTGSFPVAKLEKSAPSEGEVSEELAGAKKSGVFATFKVKQGTLTDDSWNLSSPKTRSVYAQIDASHPSLAELFDIGQGMQTGCNEVFGGHSAAQARKLKLGRTWSRKRAANSDIDRYELRDRHEHLIWVEDADDLRELPRPLRKYLLENRQKLRKRAAYKRKNCEWWQFTWPLHRELYSQEKIVAPFLSDRNRFALDRSRRFIGLTDTVVLFKKSAVKEDILYFLALLNSRLLDFRFKGIAKLKGGGIYEYFWNSVSKLPIRRINFQDKTDRLLHDQLVQYAGRLIEFKSRLRAAKSDATRESLSNTIRATEEKVDQIVFTLYGITETELGNPSDEESVLETKPKPDHRKERRAGRKAPSRKRQKEQLQTALF